MPNFNIILSFKEYIKSVSYLHGCDGVKGYSRVGSLGWGAPGCSAGGQW